VSGWVAIITQCFADTAPGFRSHHLLRPIDKHISFEFVRQQPKDSYNETGRPSLDPELLLRILQIVGRFQESRFSYGTT
jgi:transposase